MGEESPVKLIGAWFSSFSFKVRCGLELKGVEYEYVEEDLMKKSETLLKYNPVYKKIPVFVHHGKPVLESMVILEYIQDMWPDEYPLLPKDPYERSVARFWIKFIEEKGMSFRTFFKTSGEEHDKAKGDILETLKTIEEQSGIGEDDDNNMFFGGDKINSVDLAFAFIAHWIGPMEQVARVKLLEAHKFPKLCAWTGRFKQISVIKNNLPDYDELVGFFKHVKENGYLTPPK